MFNVWLHLVALVVFLGAVVGFWLIFLPSVTALDKHEQRVHFLTRGLKLYNPLQIGALGIVLFTGAFQLTELKAAYREMFIKQLGYPLAIKLTLVFFLVIFAVYQSMGIGHRFVRRQESGETYNPEQLAGILKRLSSATWLILVFAALTLWFGLRLRA
ncbi:MAG: hypothetical protein FJ145_19610 [Deltaproteobacteria bacterium]|nr:hypothetical protein [Deltaproteobacteria bacterium]